MEAFVTGAICFCIAGWGIPVYTPSLIFDGEYTPWKVRIGAGLSLLLWAGCLSLSVTYFVNR